MIISSLANTHAISKSCRNVFCPMARDSVLECGCPLPLSRSVALTIQGRQSPGLVRSKRMRKRKRKRKTA
jgi:hypothetical protein